MWFQTQLKTKNSSACVRQILPYQFTGWSEAEANYQQLSRSCLGFSVSSKETQAPTLPAMSPCCLTHANRRQYEEAGLGKHTDLLFAFRKRGSSRADTEYRVVISGGWYGISPSSPSGSGVDSTSVSSGKLKERSLQKNKATVIQSKNTGLVCLNVGGLQVSIPMKNFFILKKASTHSGFFQSTSTILSTPLVSSFTRTMLYRCSMVCRNLESCWKRHTYWWGYAFHTKMCSMSRAGHMIPSYSSTSWYQVAFHLGWKIQGVFSNNVPFPIKLLQRWFIHYQQENI